MANESKKDFNAMMKNNKDMPKIQIVEDVKYPEAIELQKRLLEEEGHTIVSKGTKNIKYYVKDFENSLIEL